MDYGDVAATADFKKRQAARGRKPTFSVFLERFGDVTDYVDSVEVDSEIEDSLHQPNFGHGSITLKNIGRVFTEASAPLIERKHKVKVYAGFEDDNIPIWTGMVNKAAVSTDQNIVTLNVAQFGQLLKDSQTSGNFEDYSTPKLLINELCGRVGLLPGVFENDTGQPDNFTFGETFVENNRNFWAMIHGACLCIMYIPYFDVNGRLQVKRRDSFTVTDFVFRDSNIKQMYYLGDADMINRKEVDFSTSVKFEFRFGDGVRPYQHSYSKTNTYSKGRWGEDADYETDPLIGSWLNAKKIVDEIDTIYPFKKSLYSVAAPGIPQLELTDQVHVDSERYGISGEFVVVGARHSISASRYTTEHKLVSKTGERM